MFQIFVCVHSNTPLLQNQELLICRRQEDAPKERQYPIFVTLVADIGYCLSGGSSVYSPRQIIIL